MSFVISTDFIEKNLKTNENEYAVYPTIYTTFILQCVHITTEHPIISYVIPHSPSSYLRPMKSHVIAHDVKLHDSGTSVTFDPVGVEGQWVAQLVAQWQGEAKVALLPKAIQHVEHGAAGCLVGLEEHDMGVGLAGAQRGALSIRGREDGATSWLDTAGGQVKGSENFRLRSHLKVCLLKILQFNAALISNGETPLNTVEHS